MKKEKVAFIGTGLIGSGLAVNAMLHGYPTYLQTRSRLERTKNSVAAMFKTLVDNAVCTQAEADSAAGLASYTTSIEEAVKGAVFIQESGPENLELKQSLYETIEGHCGHDAVIASSTSALLPSKLQAAAKYPGRILAGHPYHPSYLLPLVELCGGDRTSQSCLDIAKAFYESIGKIPVVCQKEAPGFLVNRISWAVMEEAKKTVLSGACSVEDMDKAIMYGPGMRMAVTGQILTISLGAEGGLRAMAQKYGGESNPEDLALADGIDRELAARDPRIGNTEDSVSAFRDELIIQLLRAQYLL